jgi:hypothetical protein
MAGRRVFPRRKRRFTMHFITTWKSRPLSPEQFDRLLKVWGKLEERSAADSSSERVCWFQFSDGSGGVTIDKVKDVEAALALGLEQSLTLGEFIELDTKIGVDLDASLPLIMKAQENARG